MRSVLGMAALVAARHAPWSHSLRWSFRNNDGDGALQNVQSSASVTSLSVNESKVESGDFVRVDFAGIADADRSGCWIGVFDAEANVTVISPPPTGDLYQDADMPWTSPMPVKFVTCTSASAEFLATGAGSTEVMLLNLRKDYKIWLCLGGKKTPRDCQDSSTIVVSNKSAPMHRHLTRTQKPSEMLVQWTALKKEEQMLKWGFAPSQYPHSQAATFTRYERSDMCGKPASAEGWWDPGYQLRAVIDSLPPRKAVYYVVGSDASGWSNEVSFTSPQPVGATEKVNLLITADVGSLEPDGFHSHWSGPDTQEQQSNLTWAHLTKAPQADIVMHYGDMSYATGYVAKWDLYMHQIEPLVSRTPYMTGQGNHERDWPGTGTIGGQDSGGECGKPTQAQFYMPTADGNQENGWYSIDQGSVHLVMMDTEKPCGRSSEQYAFLERDLGAVDRSRTPWVIFGGHRPMYRVERTTSIGPDLSDAFCDGAPDMEPLLVKYQVDLALWGHVHNALVTCPVINGTCVDAKQHAPVHAVVGNGGQVLSGVPPVKAAWTRYQANQWGWSQIFVHNATHLQMTFADDLKNKLQYEFWIVRG